MYGLKTEYNPQPKKRKEELQLSMIFTLTFAKGF